MRLREGAAGSSHKRVVLQAHDWLRVGSRVRTSMYTAKRNDRRDDLPDTTAALPAG
jgi:hypothetical protein